MTAVHTIPSIQHADAHALLDRWLPAWTGGDPERLLSFYTDDVFYSDPAVRGGIEGKNALHAYFQKLLAVYPDWVWRNRSITLMEHGFLNHWEADVPVRGVVVQCIGVCTVELQSGLIRRNEVFFDRSDLLRALGK